MPREQTYSEVLYKLAAVICSSAMFGELTGAIIPKRKPLLTRSF
jgi:hypothetical protein